MESEHKPGKRDGSAQAPAAAAPTVGKVASSYAEAAEAAESHDSPVDQALGQAGGGEPHASGAKLHTGPAAQAAARELGAAAFTAGDNIYFGEGQHAPGTPEGDQLLEHELAHVQQTKGGTPPTPGNYKVSKPDDAAEVAATEAETGEGSVGSAESGTIHLKKKITAPAAPTVDKLQEFFDALAASNVADAQTKWAALNAKEKAKMRKASVAKYPATLKADPVESILEIMAKDGLGILKEVKAAFDKLSYADHILDDATHDAAYWMPALKGASLYNPWLAKLPDHAKLTEARLTKLEPWMKEATTITDTRKLFEHAYPKLKDASYGPAFLKAAKWEVDDVKRMWKSLQGKVPLTHAQTISGGFNLGTQEKLFTKNAAGTLVWTTLGFGWHDPGVHMIVMPKNSSTATEGGTTHDMTGGSGSGVVPAGTAADPLLSHWDGTMLHEIGHGVGDRTDGNSFAKKHGDWKGSQTWDVWSRKLFDDAAATAALPTPAPKKLLPAATARQFLAKEIAGGAFLPPKWTRPDVVAFINMHYAGQKLVGYWTKVKSGTDAYKADTDNDGGDSRTYVWLSRGGLNYTSYKKDISDNKVSWYSLSSTVEWFAEQYANYYRTGKSGAGADTDTKAKLAAIDKMDATKSGGLKASATPGAGGASEGSSEGGGDPGGSASNATAGAKGGGPPPAVDNSSAAVAARIHRMNFE
ncbi:MAG: DUF4157 domain-containing protein [Myxococcota bacterium]|nr:DUF4157 domain-containing protein [Myxococcota bacterium]